MTRPLLLAAVTSAAAGETLYDQIGNDDGSALAGDIYSSMHFLPVLPETSDIAAVDAVTIAQRSDVDGVEFVLNGWGGFDGPGAVTNWQVNVYSDLEAAASNLIGNILSQDSDPIFIEGWAGDGWLVRLPVSLTLDPGVYLLSVIMSNPYPDNGWAGVATSTLGDDQAWQVSPGGNYVFSPFIEAPDNLAYRLTGTPVPSPGTMTLLLAASLIARRRRT
ncbi:MAG: hypothetical protein QGG74_01400 [Phycisphaerales bacterium]|jgi:hypothetical protein|nr:hypothetical protein [Phycisphaerales bacterium]